MFRHFIFFMPATISFSRHPGDVESIWSTNVATNPQAETSGELALTVRDNVAHNIAHDTSETTQEIDYKLLANEHAELIKEGKTSVEIAQWIGDKLNIPSWESWEFYGERKVLSSPKTSEETARLSKFVEALGVSWTKANQPSENHPQYLLLDGYVQNALFGQENMKKIDTILETFYSGWKNMWKEFMRKAQYLFEQVGLSIRGDWTRLTGVRDIESGFISPNLLYVSGSLSARGVRWLWLRRHGSENGATGSPARARLCFLA